MTRGPPAPSHLPRSCRACPRRVSLCTPGAGGWRGRAGAAGASETPPKIHPPSHHAPQCPQPRPRAGTADPTTQLSPKSQGNPTGPSTCTGDPHIPPQDHGDPHDPPSTCRGTSPPRAGKTPRDPHKTSGMPRKGGGGSVGVRPLPPSRGSPGRGAGGGIFPPTHAANVPIAQNRHGRESRSAPRPPSRDIPRRRRTRPFPGAGLREVLKRHGSGGASFGPHSAYGGSPYSGGSAAPPAARGDPTTHWMPPVFL